MQNETQPIIPANQVMALFAGSIASFRLSGGATFADLADCLEHIDARHVGAPTAIVLKFASTGRPAARLAPAL